MGVYLMSTTVFIRTALSADLEAVRQIYNEGIEDRVATLEESPKTTDDIAAWWAEHDDRFMVLLAVDVDKIVGWASLNRYSNRANQSGVGVLSVYIARSHRGQGIGAALIRELEQRAAQAGFHKIVLYALDRNEQGKHLYRKSGFSDVGVFREHGVLDSHYVDVILMEKLL
jgi:phosphinothricin acetyltransferase